MADRTGLSRRDLLRRGVIAGGATWAAPGVLTMRAAGAQGTPEGACATVTRTRTDVQLLASAPADLSVGAFESDDASS